MPSVLEALNTSLHRAFAADERVLLLGEDLLDPYGGAFKVSRGLSSAYPARVLSSPISEAGLAGVAAGMALRGLRPVVEIMFGDFITLIADQLINHIAKFRWMYNEQVRVPLVVRTPMGGRRGYGPTHSQTLEKHFLGVSGLRVLAPSALGQPGELLEAAILHDDDPVLFIENKLLYLLPTRQAPDLPEFELKQAHIPGYAPTYILRLAQAPPPSLTLAAYGYMAEIACKVMLRLAYDHEVFTELIVPTQLAPFELEPILHSAAQTGRLLTLEEGGVSLGWGAEVLARAVEAPGAGRLIARRVAARDLPVPASGPLENAVLPAEADVLQAALALNAQR